MSEEKVKSNNLLEKVEKQRDRNRALFKCASKWIEINELGADIVSFFKKRKFNRVAIYGMGELGHLLCISLIRKNIKVGYYVDQAAESSRSKDGLPVYLPEELKEQEPVDVIIVTPVFYFNEISSKLMQVDIGLPLVSLDSIMNECLGELWYEQHCKQA